MRKRSVALLLPLLLAACAGSEVIYKSGNFPAAVPGEVAVLPFDNETTSMDGAEMLRKMAARRLAAHGFYSLPLDEIDARLKEIGVTDGGQLGAYKPVEIGRAVGSKGLMYGVLEAFTYQNIGFVRRRKVRLRLWLVEAGSGEKLWEAAGQEQGGKVELNKDNAGAAFLAGVIEAAAEKVMRAPLKRESRRVINKLFRKYPRR